METYGQNRLLVLTGGSALRTPARTSKERDQQERLNPIHAENHARDNKIASKKGLKIAEKTPQAYF